VQCVATNAALALDMALVKPGQTQQPELWDYADRVDTMAFLQSL
jgi:hypothetical protein